MTGVPLAHVLSLSGILFVLGLAGVIARRNLIFMLMGIEIMLNAAGLAFVAGGSRFGQADGQIMFMLVLTLAAVEVAIGLALVLLHFRRHQTVDADAASSMRG